MTFRRLLLPVALGCVMTIFTAFRISSAPAASRADADRDLLDVTVPQLHRLYAAKTYTVTQVVQWHLDRIDRYNGVYGAIETVLRRQGTGDDRGMGGVPPAGP